MTILTATKKNSAIEELARDPLIQQYAPGCSAAVKQSVIEQSVIRRLQEMLKGTQLLSPPDKLRLLNGVDSLLSRWKITSTPPKNIQEMERCALAVRLRLPLYLTSNGERIPQLQERVQAHQRGLLKKWAETYHFSEKLFFEFPDFVDFVFASHLHKALKYHSKQVEIIRGEPCILVDGTHRPWKEIKAEFFVEKGKIYSLENGMKQRWEYLYQGLTRYNANAWTEPKPIRVLNDKPGCYSLQVVVSHVSEEHQNFSDRVLKGARHSWFRLITPEGEMYSFGWGLNPADVNMLQPLVGVNTVINCPDTFEYYADHRLETTFPISIEAGQKVMQIVKSYVQGGGTFNILTSNCADFTKEILAAAGIESISLERHAADLLYKLFVPKIIRKVVKLLGAYTVHLVIPACITNAVRHLRNFVVSLIIMPLLSLLGAWRVNRRKSTEPEPIPFQAPAIGADMLQNKRLDLIRKSIMEFVSQEREVVRKKVQPLYASLGDVFNPNRLTFTMTHILAKWQRQQGDKTKFY